MESWLSSRPHLQPDRKHDGDLQLLETVLREGGYTNFTFRRDDTLLAKLVE